MLQAPGSFNTLTPHVVSASVEAFFDHTLDGTVERYPSYVNRVYGLRTDSGEPLVVKFYRPDRWSTEAILAEHRFLDELARADVPVVAPLPDLEGDTVFEVEVDATEQENAPVFRFALFPRRGGRGFDAESDEDWFRLGSIVGRMHAVAKQNSAPERFRIDPKRWTGTYVTELLDAGAVHPDCSEEFREVSLSTIDRITPIFNDVPEQRLHGDCHRGNILDRPGEGLLLIDFDDMMEGPAVQDLWLLLPDHATEVTRELTMLLNGYRQFTEFDTAELDLIEPLRFMRIIHFLAWQLRQRNDLWFRQEHTEWGNRAFWIKEIEDLREQALHLEPR